MFSEVLKLLENYGLGTVVVLAVCAVLYGFYDKYLSFYFNDKLNKRKQRTKDKDEEQCIERRKNSLKDQEFFSNVQFKMNVDLVSEEFSKDPVRSELFKDIIRILFQAYYDTMLNFVKTVDPEWTKDEWARTINKEMLVAIEKFNERCQLENIPPEAVKRFLLWLSPYMQQVYFYIRKVRGMGNRNAIENTNTFLLLLELILTNVLSDVQKYTIFNGSLKGLEYKDSVIGD